MKNLRWQNQVDFHLLLYSYSEMVKVKNIKEKKLPRKSIYKLWKDQLSVFKLTLSKQIATASYVFTQLLLTITL